MALKLPVATRKLVLWASKVALVKSEDNDAPLAKPKHMANNKGKVATTTTKGKNRLPKKKAKQESESKPDVGSEDDVPTPPLKKAPAKANRKVKVESEAGDKSFSEDDKPLKKKQATATPKEGAASLKVKLEASNDVKPKNRGAKREEEDTDTMPKKGKAKQEEEAEGIYKWWEERNANYNGSVKWETLEHNGVSFPPPYEPLPNHVKMKYNGKFTSPCPCYALDSCSNIHAFRSDRQAPS